MNNIYISIDILRRSRKKLHNILAWLLIVRAQVGLLMIVRRTLSVIRREGAKGLFIRVRAISVMRLAKKTGQRPDYGAIVLPSARSIPNRILIIADKNLAQCFHYRVKQKIELFRTESFDCVFSDWQDERKCRDLLQITSIVIFYRLPAYPHVLSLIEEAKRLNVPSFYELDDLIFEPEIYRENVNIDRLPADLRQSVLDGVPLFRRALQACDHVIASTFDLAQSMAPLSPGQTYIIENALDGQTLAIAERVREERGRLHAEAERRGDTASRPIWIAYGSASLAHDADFDKVTDALLRLAEAERRVHILIIGTLTLPPAFQRLGERLRTLPLMPYEAYLGELAKADINLAPLQLGRFNDAKSNIKFLEAAILGLPTVASPASPYRAVIEDGRNGFLAETPDEWFDKLHRLVSDRPFRLAMGQAAQDTAIERYHPQAVAATQARPFGREFLEPVSRKLRVLSVNIYFRPFSFGGATVVAEHLADRLHQQGDTEVVVFTGSDGQGLDPYEIFRYESHGVPVVAVGLPAVRDPATEYRNPDVTAIFRDVLAAVRPDVVHFHSVQWLGAELGVACRDAGVPFVVTLHDAWWLCQRQFMVHKNGRYCMQTKIDPMVCARCVVDAGASERRLRFLREVLDSASLLLSPSEFHRRLHIANGIDAKRILVNRNGVQKPGPTFHRQVTKGHLRFGFVGGLGPVKGGSLIIEAFRDIGETNYTLCAVDAHNHLGTHSMSRDDWPIPGHVEIVPGYRQETMDDFYQQIDVLLFPSQWKESFGLTVREALSRDIWVIATDSGGVVEDIVDGENGTVIPFTDDYRPLRDAIQTLLRDPDSLDGFRNPFTEQIWDFEKQATELYTALSSVARP